MQYPVSAQYAPLAGMAKFTPCVAYIPVKKKRTTKPCKACGAELPFEAYRMINPNAGPRHRHRSPRCPACEAGSTRIKNPLPVPVSLANQLMAAQTSTDDWRTASYKNSRPDTERAKTRKELAEETKEEKLQELLARITTKPVTAKYLEELTLISTATLNKRLRDLVERGSICRSDQMPYFYFLPSTTK